MTPLGNKVLIKPFPKEERKTESGIILGDDKQPLARGEVIAPPADVEVSLKKGDVVRYPANAGTPVEQGDQTFLVLTYDNIWLVE